MKYIKDNLNAIGKVLFVLLLLSFAIYGYLKNNDIESDKMYTIATVNRVRVNSNIGESVYYTYFVDDSLYIAKDNFHVDVYNFTIQNIVGKRFMLKFQKTNPQNSRLLPNIRIGYEVKAPKLGWETIEGGEEGRKVISNK